MKKRTTALKSKCDSFCRKGNVKRLQSFDICFHMLAIVASGTYGGILLDRYYKFTIPLFLCIFAPLSVVLAVYVIIKKLKQ